MLGEQAVQRIIRQVLGIRRPTRPRCVFFGQGSQLTRFANNHIHQNVAEANTQISVRVVAGQEDRRGLDQRIGRRAPCSAWSSAP